MEELKFLLSERRIIRCSFTKLYNKLETGTVLQELSLAWVQIQEKHERLEKINNQVKCILMKNDVNDEEFEKEIEQCEEYRDKFSYIKLKSNKVEQCTENCEKSSCSRNLKLPEIKLITFDGEPRSWLNFWGQFGRIHDDIKIAKEDKFQYLIQSLKEGSKPRALVEKFPASSEGYDQAIDHLQARFGQKETLIEIYVRDLISLIMNSSENKNLSLLYDLIESYLRSLNALGIVKSTFSPVLYPLVESCLPKNILLNWERWKYFKSESVDESKIDDFEDDKSMISVTGISKLELLMKFLRQEAEGEERIKLAKDFKQIKGDKEKDYKGKMESKPRQPSGMDLVNNTGKPTFNCIFCKKAHPSQECKFAKDLPLEKRISILKENKHCLICLKKGHFARDCKSYVCCMYCKKRHFTLMCKELETTTVEKVLNKPCEENSLMSNTINEVILQTLCIKLKTNKGFKICRVIIDSGSQHSYISTGLVKGLGIKPKGEQILSHCLFGNETRLKKHNIFKVNLFSLDGLKDISINVLDEPKICGYVPRLKNEECLRELAEKGIFLEQGKNLPTDISLLLGSEAIAKLYTGKLVHLRCGPCALETHLGWTVLGKVKGDKTTSTLCLTNFTIPKAMWDIETLGILDPVTVKSKRESDEEVLKHFQKNIIQLESGRYEVSLPWSEKISQLEPNFEVVYKRLLSVTKKLEKENIIEQYEKVFREWELLGIIQEIPLQKNNGHFLAHHAVLKENSLSTKIRPVFDASFKGKNLICLNDCLASGPNLIEFIPVMLMRFRLNKLGVVSDISKAFLQISINEKDREFFKFLWWSDKSKNILKCYQHTRVVFGVITSPFQLIRTINHHIESASPEFKEIAERLKFCFYFDDFVCSVNSESELKNLIERTVEFMKVAKFEFKSWIYTNQNTETSECNVLGVQWNNSFDYLSCKIAEIILELPVTKRKILSVVNKVIYDPIGFTAPATITPRILLKQCWAEKLDWDEIVPEHIGKPFVNWVSEIKHMSECKIPRWMFNESSMKYSLHIFCDASQNAYGACIFVRSENGFVQLVLSKCRLSPLKQKVTIPRLELMSAIIGTRLFVQVIKVLNQATEVIFWSDSTTVLSWIKNTSIQNDIFVRNRVTEILNYTEKESWRHVPGELNTAADLLSRGCSPANLPSSRWWEGPNWLKQNSEEWPKSEFQNYKNEKKTVTCINIKETCQNDILERCFERISSYIKLIRVVCYIFRTAKICKKEKVTGPITNEEIKNVECFVWRHIQVKTEIEKDKSLNNIIFESDENGLLRVKSKLILSKEYEDNFIRPILIPNKHIMVERLIEFYHKKLGHAGVGITLCKIRENFWIIRGRMAVKRVISKCVTCLRFKGKPVKATPAPLPLNRIETVSCFSITGIDAAGPLYLKDNSKCWIIVFTCGTYRAVHFEIVTSMSTECFLQAMRRFIARRGRISVCYSDNGSNFVGSRNLLKGIDWDKVQQDSNCSKIIWKLIPPSAPWWGGWWERIIRILKDLLRKILGKASVNFEELSTIMCDCESFINSRPLTYMSDSNEDLIPLTPMHFLNDIKCSEVPDIDYLNAISFSKRTRYTHKLREELKLRFKSEYLSNLVSYRQLNKGHRRELQVGEIVLIGSDNLKRLLWPLGKILEFCPGKDGAHRVALLKTAKGKYTRPVQRLYPLEVFSTSDEAESISKCLESEILPLTENMCIKDNNDIKFTRKGRKIKIPNKLNL